MPSFLKRIIERLRYSARRKQLEEGTIDFGDRQDNAFPKRARKFDADVHKLMIRATGLKREKGYPAAIEYLKDIAEKYIKDQNTALVTCINKLIPYMKREPSIEFKETYSYLSDVIERMPPYDTYFNALHITMAELIQSRNLEEALAYIHGIVNTQKSTDKDFNLYVKLAELYIEQKNPEKADKYLIEARDLLHSREERYSYIKSLRKWHRVRALYSLLDTSEYGMKEYLRYRFLEFCLDIARVLDPLHIENFHHRKDMYFKKERGFEDTELFSSTINTLRLDEKKKDLIKELYGFAFEEMPGLLHITKKQLNYKPGDEESLEELQVKKLYYRKPFQGLPLIEDFIERLLNKYLQSN